MTCGDATEVENNNLIERIAQRRLNNWLHPTVQGGDDFLGRRKSDFITHYSDPRGDPKKEARVFFLFGAVEFSVGE